MTAPTKKAAFFMLGMMMIALSFGESITFSGIKVSWLFAAVIFVLTVFHVIISKGSYAKRQKEVKALAFFALFWGVYSLLQGFWAKDTELWNQGIVSTLINIFLVTVLGYFISDERDIDSFLKYSVPLWIINIAFGLYEAITNEHFVKASSESISSAFVRTCFVTPNDSATWLTLCFLMLSYYLKRKNAKSRK